MEKLKSAVLVVIKAGMEAEKFGSDASVLTKVLSLVPFVAQIPEIIENKQAIVDEFNNRTEEKLAELNKFIKDELKLTNDRLEAQVEAAAAVIIAVLVLVGTFKAVNDGSTPA